VQFGDICRINYGAQISSRERGGFGRDEHLHEDAEALQDAKKFYEGSNMRPFGMTWAGAYLDWRPPLFYGPRTTSLFENEKLSIRHISGDADTFVAWVDRNHYYTDHGVIHCVPYHAVAHEPTYRVTEHQAQHSRNYPLFFLLGVVMSRPVLTYYAELFATGSLQGAFSHVYPETVKELPIPRLTEPLGDPAADWTRRTDELAGGAVDRGTLRRLFPTRNESAATLAAVAERRQQLEGERAQRAMDFRDFMRTRLGGWGWPRGQSLDAPSTEDDFLQSLADQLDTVQAMTAVRDAFRKETTEARRAAEAAANLQRAMDALAERVFALQA
jgi:TaqI-like C-terminal specificity domain